MSGKLKALIAFAIFIVLLIVVAVSYYQNLGIISSGRNVAFVLLLILFLAGYSFIGTAKEGKAIPVRKIAAFDAIEEGIARSVELGKPVHFTLGYGPISTVNAPQYLAGLGVLGHVARLCAKYGAPLISTLGVPELIAAEEEIIRDAYYSGGKPELYNVTYNVRYLTDQQFAYASAVQATLHRENVGANIVVGPFWAESLIFMEAGAAIDAFQVAGTARETQIPFFVLAADYAFIGEEIFAAGAMASGDIETLASIRGQDFGKLISWILIVVGLILLPVGIKLAEYLVK
ncbi:MAG: DUF6754 domain-containing protein [Candidatus Bathyarchaeia archaeon]